MEQTEHQKKLDNMNRASIVPCCCGDLADSVMTLEYYDSKIMSARVLFSIHDFYNPKFFKHYEPAGWKYNFKKVLLSIWIAIWSSEPVPYKLSIIVDQEDEKQRLLEMMGEFGIKVEFEADQVQEKLMKSAPTDYSIKNSFYATNPLSFWDRLILMKDGMVFKTLDGYMDGDEKSVRVS